MGTMKTFLSLAFALAVFATLTACDDKPRTVGEKIENKVGDATDSRPGEKVRDAAENTKEAVKDTARDVKDAVKNP